MFTILKYKMSTIDHGIYIKVFTDETVYYFTVPTDDFINTTNNKTALTEPTRVFEEYFEMKLQEVSVLKYLNFRNCQSTFDISINQTDHTRELVNKRFPTGKFRKVDTLFWTDSAYKN